MNYQTTNFLKAVLAHSARRHQFEAQSLKQLQRQPIVRQQTSGFHSSLFSQKLQQIRKQAKSGTDDQQGSDNQQEAGDKQQMRTTGLFTGTAKVRYGDPYKSEMLHSMDLDGVLNALKRSLSETQRNVSNQFFHTCMDRINQIITERNSKVGRNEVLTILKELSYFRPKEQEIREKQRKRSGHLHQHEIQDDILSVRHKELLNQQSSKFRSVPGDVANFVYQNLSKGFFKDMFTQFDEDQKSKFGTSLYDVLADYIQLYQNLEVRVNDMLSKGMFNSQEALDILVSYAIAEEGTNTLYIRLIQNLIRRTEDYNMVEIEMILNYFPHNIWKSEAELGKLREAFYFPIIHTAKENLDKLDKRQFLSIFQGLTLAGDQIFKPELLNMVLNSFIMRIKAQDTEGQFSMAEVMSFLELYVQFLRMNSSLLQQVDSPALIKFTNQQYIQQNSHQLSFHQICGLYWVYHSLGSLYDVETVETLEHRICQLLREELVLQKNLEKDYKADVAEGLQTINVDDIEIVEHYYNSDFTLKESSKKQKEIFKLIRQAKHWNKPEKERKWFHL